MQRGWAKLLYTLGPGALILLLHLFAHSPQGGLSAGAGLALMLAAPYLVAGTVAALVIAAYRRPAASSGQGAVPHAPGVPGIHPNGSGAPAEKATPVRDGRSR